MSELSKALKRAKGTRSIDEIVKAAASRGHAIDRSAVSRYVNGEHGPKPRESTLAALAAGFDVDVRVLRELAGKPAGEREPYVPVPEAASLTQRQRKAVDNLILAFVSEGSADGLAPDAQKTPPAAPAAPTSLKERRQLKMAEDAEQVERAADTNKRANQTEGES